MKHLFGDRLETELKYLVNMVEKLENYSCIKKQTQTRPRHFIFDYHTLGSGKKNSIAAILTYCYGRTATHKQIYWRVSTLSVPFPLLYMVITRSRTAKGSQEEDPISGLSDPAVWILLRDQIDLDLCCSWIDVTDTKILLGFCFSSRLSTVCTTGS